ncbi:hypothetical protein F52700_5759 [Fusarium sp. NRRL 52700]|nr:hypothetical protein F52700_5759 [Fusarium sp. NRRL 52700]
MRLKNWQPYTIYLTFNAAEFNAKSLKDTTLAHRAESADLLNCPENCSYKTLRLATGLGQALFSNLVFPPEKAASKAKEVPIGLRARTCSKEMIICTSTWSILDSQPFCNMMQNGGDDIVASMNKSREHFGAMGRTDPSRNKTTTPACGADKILDPRGAVIIPTRYSSRISMKRDAGEVVAKMKESRERFAEMGKDKVLDHRDVRHERLSSFRS